MCCKFRLKVCRGEFDEVISKKNLYYRRVRWKKEKYWDIWCKWKYVFFSILIIKNNE